MCVAPFALLPFFSTLEATQLRLVCKGFRDAVAAHPWADCETLVQDVTSWQACFPRARAVAFAMERLCWPKRLSSPIAGLQPPEALRGLTHVDASLLRNSSKLNDLLLSLSPGVTFLRLRDCERVPGETLARLTGLRHLDVSGSFCLQPGLAPPATLGALRSLRELHLGGCSSVTDASLAPLGSTLEVLDISSCPGLSDAALAHFWGGRLRSLKADYCTGITDAAFGGLGGALRELSLQGCTQATLTDAAFAPLGQLARLCCSLTGPHLTAAALAPLQGTLQELDVRHCQSHSLAAGALSLPPSCPLHTLRASEGFCVEDPPPAEPTLALLARLRHLHLSGATLSEGTLLALARHSPPPCLETLQVAPPSLPLEVGHCPPWAFPHSLAALDALRGGFPCLHSLRIFCTAFAKALVQAPGAVQAALLPPLGAGLRCGGGEGHAASTGSSKWDPPPSLLLLHTLRRHIPLETLLRAGFPVASLLEGTFTASGLGSGDHKGPWEEDDLAIPRALLPALARAFPHLPPYAHFRALLEALPALGRPGGQAVCRSVHLPPRDLLPAPILVLAQQAGLGARVLLEAGVGLKALVAGGCSVGELRGAGASLVGLRRAGVGACAARRGSSGGGGGGGGGSGGGGGGGGGYTLGEFLGAGYTVGDLCKPDSFSSAFTLGELVGARLPLAQLACFGARRLRLCGVGYKRALASGLFTQRELLEAGYTEAKG